MIMEMGNGGYIVLARQEKKEFFRPVSYNKHTHCVSGRPYSQQRPLALIEAQEAERLLKDRKYEVVIAELPVGLAPDGVIDLDDILLKEELHRAVKGKSRA